MIDKNGLYTILNCSINNGLDDITKFDLVSTHLRILNLNANLFFRFRITFENLADFEKLQNAMTYAKAKIVSIFDISAGESGRENSYDFIYDISNSNIPLRFCILKLIFPQFITCGIYNKVD